MVSRVALREDPDQIEHPVLPRAFGPTEVAESDIRCVRKYHPFGGPFRSGGFGGGAPADSDARRRRSRATRRAHLASGATLLVNTWSLPQSIRPLTAIETMPISW